MSLLSSTHAERQSTATKNHQRTLRSPSANSLHGHLCSSSSSSSSREQGYHRGPPSPLSPSGAIARAGSDLQGKSTVPPAWSPSTPRAPLPVVAAHNYPSDARVAARTPPRPLVKTPTGSQRSSARRHSPAERLNAESIASQTRSSLPQIQSLGSFNSASSHTRAAADSSAYERRLLQPISSSSGTTPPSVQGSAASLPLSARAAAHLSGVAAGVVSPCTAQRRSTPLQHGPRAQRSPGEVVMGACDGAAGARGDEGDVLALVQFSPDADSESTGGCSASQLAASLPMRPPNVLTVASLSAGGRPPSSAVRGARRQHTSAAHAGRAPQDAAGGSGPAGSATNKSSASVSPMCATQRADAVLSTLVAPASHLGGVRSASAPGDDSSRSCPVPGSQPSNASLHGSTTWPPHARGQAALEHLCSAGVFDDDELHEVAFEALTAEEVGKGKTHSQSQPQRLPPAGAPYSLRRHFRHFSLAAPSTTRVAGTELQLQPRIGGRAPLSTVSARSSASARRTAAAATGSSSSVYSGAGGLCTPAHTACANKYSLPPEHTSEGVGPSPTAPSTLRSGSLPLTMLTASSSSSTNSGSRRLFFTPFSTKSRSSRVPGVSAAEAARWDAEMGDEEEEEEEEGTDTDTDADEDGQATKSQELPCRVDGTPLGQDPARGCAPHDSSHQSSAMHYGSREESSRVDEGNSSGGGSRVPFSRSLPIDAATEAERRAGNTHFGSAPAPVNVCCANSCSRSGSRGSSRAADAENLRDGSASLACVSAQCSAAGARSHALADPKKQSATAGASLTLPSALPSQHDMHAVSAFASCRSSVLSSPAAPPAEGLLDANKLYVATVGDHGPRSADAPSVDGSRSASASRESTSAEPSPVAERVDSTAPASTTRPSLLDDPYNRESFQLRALPSCVRRIPRVKVPPAGGPGYSMKAWTTMLYESRMTCKASTRNCGAAEDHPQASPQPPSPLRSLLDIRRSGCPRAGLEALPRLKRSVIESRTAQNRQWRVQHSAPLAVADAGRTECLMVIRGVVYNVAPFLNYHPGGTEIVLDCEGKDATAVYDCFHSWVSCENMLGPYAVGVFDPDD